jgi:hypothetical protein
MLVDEEGVVLRAFVPEQDPKAARHSCRSHTHSSPACVYVSRRSNGLLSPPDRLSVPLAETLRLASLTVQPSGISLWRFEQYPFDVRLGEEGIALQLGRLPLALRYITQQHLAVRAVDLSYRKRIIIIPNS